MIWPEKRKHVRRRTNRTIGLNLRGRSDPEVYRVCEDVYGIVEKMLSANQTIGVFSRHPRFDFDELLFLLGLLGVPANDPEGEYSAVDLWISEG